MKTKFLIFSLLATFAMTNVFATEGNSEKQVAEEIHQQKVDQKVTPKSSNYIMFDNQTGEGNQRTMQVNFVTMNMTFAVAASDAARALQLGDYKNYVWKNSRVKFWISTNEQNILNFGLFSSCVFEKMDMYIVSYS